jgi:hypothetical protein
LLIIVDCSDDSKSVVISDDEPLAAADVPVVADADVDTLRFVGIY